MGGFKNSFLPEESFKDWGTYKHALGQTIPRLKNRVFTRSSASEEILEVGRRSENELKRSLNWWDLMWFSIGAVIGAGVFVLTGQEARNTAGPAIIISYAASGLAAMLAVFSYTEFAVEIPVAGGSFAYLRVELGDFVAFVAAGNIILEYIIGGAAVARAWTSYFAALINTKPDSLRIHTNLASGYNMLDPIAVAILLITGVVAVYSTKGTSILNWIASLVNMTIIIFIIIAGLAHADASNYTPFIPASQGTDFGVRGIFTAASVLFFAYLGFDAVATMAEETKNPSRDIPIGLVGSMTITTLIYCLMALTLCLMQKYTEIDPDAPFSFAFASVGWKWAQYVIALGALKGMTTVILVSNVGQARYLTHIARTHLISPWFAQVNTRTRTPINATVCMVLATAVIAFFTELSVLGNLLSVSTLFIFTLVSIALLVRRYIVKGETTKSQRNLFIVFLIVILGGSIGTATYWATSDGWIGYVITLPIWIGGTILMAVVIPKHRHPTIWGVPLVPWIPSMSIAINVFLLGSMDHQSFIRFAVWTGIMLVYYFLFGLHASYDTAIASMEKLPTVQKPEIERNQIKPNGSSPAAGEGEVVGAHDSKFQDSAVET